MMQQVNKEIINYHVAVCSAAYFESLFDSLHLLVGRERLGLIHQAARKRVATALDKANKDA